jgi:hypothetical protein
MKIIAKRYVDEHAPGAELAAGRYDEATLSHLLEKGHFVIVEDEEPATAATLDPEKAEAEAKKRREAAVKKFAGKEADKLATAEAPQPLIVERLPGAESDTSTRVYTPEPEGKEKKPAKG